ncbi:MAG TPA: PEP-CTERM sorting domain-containing protein [Terriglobales bacterium]|nr:PEP-CTERM sorting domain-containing protein [Terriglobales bacterium]
MKTHFLVSLPLIALAGIVTLPAVAGTVYENGPINGNTDAWTINFGFWVGDTFTVSAGTSTITGFSFGAWLMPGDTLETAQLTIESRIGGGTVYFNQVIPFTASGCALNQYGYDVCEETSSFSGPTLNNGTYWSVLQNAVTSEGNPVYWDENSGIGCHSPGCPSQSFESEGSIPSESFTVLGTLASSTVPEPSDLVLFASGFLGLAGILRRRLF